MHRARAPLGLIEHLLLVALWASEGLAILLVACLRPLVGGRRLGAALDRIETHCAASRLALRPRNAASAIRWAVRRFKPRRSRILRRAADMAAAAAAAETVPRMGPATRLYGADDALGVAPAPAPP